MTHKFTDPRTLVITPVTLSRSPKILEVWKHPKEGTCHISTLQAGRKIEMHLSDSETRALAKHLDPEAAQAKEVLKGLRVWLESDETPLEKYKVEAVRQKIKELGVEL